MCIWLRAQAQCVILHARALMGRVHTRDSRALYSVDVPRINSAAPVGANMNISEIGTRAPEIRGGNPDGMRKLPQFSG